IPAERIKRSTYGVDSAALEPLLDTRAALPSGWPRRFLFVGKYDHIKGVDILMRAYEAYRRMVVDPWDMVCCGAGPLVGLIAGQTGVVDKGFLQPHQVRAELLAAGAFVLASRRDQWPLAIAEACAAGLPIVCSDACGVASELLRDYWNGVRVPPGSVSGLAEALLWVHQEADRAPELGRRSQALAAPFAAGAWADRVLRAVRA